LEAVCGLQVTDLLGRLEAPAGLELDEKGGDWAMEQAQPYKTLKDSCSEAWLSGSLVALFLWANSRGIVQAKPGVWHGASLGLGASRQLRQGGGARRGKAAGKLDAARAEGLLHGRCL